MVGQVVINYHQKLQKLAYFYYLKIKQYIKALFVNKNKRNETIYNGIMNKCPFIGMDLMELSKEVDFCVEDFQNKVNEYDEDDLHHL